VIAADRLEQANGQKLLWLLLRMAGSRSLTSFVRMLSEGFVLNCEEGGGAVVYCVRASPVRRDHLGGGQPGSCVLHYTGVVRLLRINLQKVTYSRV
jgi:hypothetical protein